MKVLFIDHECHRQTGSVDFLVEILRRDFEVEEHYYRRNYETGAEARISHCDLAAIFEFPISRRRFFFPDKRNVFIPMFDNEWASDWQWRRIAWSGMGVVSFCGRVSTHARRCGVNNLLDVRYFPNPADFPQAKGDPKRVFLWERGDVGEHVAKTLFPPSNGYVIDVKRHDEFLERRAYLERLSRCAIVIAPRRKEGIGMAFLEAMAMGKCVVAHNDATMNEYIRDGENGILFNADAPMPVSEDAVARVLAGVSTSAAGLHARWRRDADAINPFLLNQTPCRPSFANRLKIALSYPIYLAEGAVNTLFQGGHS